MSIFHVEDEFFGNQIILEFWEVLEYFLIQIYNSRFICVFRYPPPDACQKLKDVVNVVDFFETILGTILGQFLTHIYNHGFIYVFRYPPADACQKLKDVLNVVDFFDDEPDIDEADELREILTHYHMKTLLQVFIF